MRDRGADHDRVGDGLQPLREILVVRESLDLATAEPLVRAMQGKEHPNLRAHVAEMQRLNAQGQEFDAADRAFHTELLEVAGNVVYGQLVAAFWDVNVVLRPELGAVTPVDMVDTVNAHGAMLDAAEAGDVEAFRAAVRAHYDPLRRVIAKSEPA